MFARFDFSKDYPYNLSLDEHREELALAIHNVLTTGLVSAKNASFYFRDGDLPEGITSSVDSMKTVVEIGAMKIQLDFGVNKLDLEIEENSFSANMGYVRETLPIKMFVNGFGLIIIQGDRCISWVSRYERVTANGLEDSFVFYDSSEKTFKVVDEDIAINVNLNDPIFLSPIRKEKVTYTEYSRMRASSPLGVIPSDIGSLMDSFVGSGYLKIDSGKDALIDGEPYQIVPLDGKVFLIGRNK